MPTKLSVFCDKVAEAGWLTAIIVVPLFFNVYSSRVFEPDKLTLLRSIALVMAVAWVVKVVEKGLGRETGPESWTHGDSEERNAADSVGSKPTFWRRVSQTPLVLPTLALVFVYILSTLFSITPWVSLWGSYQRLQGTYTTFSYIVIFFLALEGLRRREQLDRLVTVVILVSLPISLYGLIQHSQLDPLPWGGDVTSRVASNMGNSIFVSAYLVMAIPLTLARLVSSSLTVFENKSLWDKVMFLFVLAIFVVAQLYAAILYVWGGLLVVLIFFIPLFGFSIYLEKPFRQFVPFGCYSGILTTQLICIYFSKSRGPMLGLLGGLYFFSLLFAVWKRSRKGAFIAVGSAVAVVSFLVIFNLSDALAPLRNQPYIGRLGRIFETESGTGLVRVLIWEGVVELVPPHEPLEFPSSEPDRWNFLRPFLGYGPEAMYVAYNRFYPPDLAHVEARNASPDRSHNETFDALVITGLVGFVVYMTLFSSLFYYGLKWLGLITNSRERSVFLCLWLGFGFLVMVGFWRVLGANFVGVALPFGMVIGLGIYLAIYTFFFYKGGTREEEAPYRILLIALLSALVAHFIEIHFGIAIAATRTYFWVYAALMVVIGHYLRRETVPAPSKVAVPAELPKEQRRAKRRRKRQAVAPPRPQPTVEAPPGPAISMMPYALLTGIVMVTMVFDYRTAHLPIATRSYSVLWLFFITLLFSGIIITVELLKAKTSQHDVADWLLAFLLYFVISLGCLFAFHFIHIGQLSVQANVANIAEVVRQADRVANTLPIYYLFLFFLLLGLATALMREVPLPARTWRITNWWLYPILMVGLIWIILVTNLNVIRADIYYKQGQAYDNKQSRDAAVELYKKSLTLAPNEDFYDLFLGRAYLERAQETNDSAQRSFFLDQGLNVLLQARVINPLNTDHSANLARYYRARGGMASEPVDKEKYLNQALEYYRQATSLSPHNAQLFNEWGLVYFMMGDHDRTMEKYQQSLALDQEFEQTYLQLGDLYMAKKELDQAAEAYSKAVELNPSQVQAHSTLSYIYSQQGKLAQAVEENLKVLELKPNDYASHKNLAILYQQLGQIDEAIAKAEAALSLAPENDRASLEDYIAQLKGRQISSPDRDLIQTYLSQGQDLLQKGDLDRAAEVYFQALALDPNIVSAHSALGYIYAQQGRFPEAMEENLTVLRLAPNDYASHKNLSILYQQLGRIDEALAEARVALGLAPENEKAAVEAFIAQLQQQAGP
ncbi:MAG: tetratricopeptide repeat protein [Anaerolineales bacterium]|nr:MAG: tetratricopeptide repeat protein [Anaerolineales bacterium]